MSKLPPPEKFPSPANKSKPYQPNQTIPKKLPMSGSFNGAKVLVTQTADLGTFNGTFQQHSKLSIKLLASGIVT